MQGKERKWFNANAFLYIYNNKLFVSDKILKSIDIVSSDRNGKNIIYYIKNPNIETVLNATVDCI